MLPELPVLLILSQRTCYNNRISFTFFLENTGYFSFRAIIEFYFLTISNSKTFIYLAHQYKLNHYLFQGVYNEKVLVSTTEGFLLNKLLNKNEKFRSGSFRQSPFYKSLDVNQGSGLRIYKRENPSSGNYYTE